MNTEQKIAALANIVKAQYAPLNPIADILRNLGNYVEDDHYYFAEDLRETATKIHEIVETYKNVFEEDIFKECHKR